MSSKWALGGRMRKPSCKLIRRMCVALQKKPIRKTAPLHSEELLHVFTPHVRGAKARGASRAACAQSLK
eukprot:1626389-Pyramimonas_sp.AAC.1